MPVETEGGEEQHGEHHERRGGAARHDRNTSATMRRQPAYIAQSLCAMMACAVRFTACAAALSARDRFRVQYLEAVYLQALCRERFGMNCKKPPEAADPHLNSSHPRWHLA